MNKLNKVLQERNISRRRLAIMACITPQSLYAAMAGNIPLYAGWRKRIADALEMSEQELFPDDEGSEEHEEK